MKSFVLFLSVLLLFIPVQPSPGADLPPDHRCYETTWPHEKSSLKPDPSLRFGRLANGFRYVLKTNTEPKNRVGVYLDVEAGSIYEQDSERGMAHFLEHLLFNGTTHFRPGELIEYFLTIGMDFGADVNAYTSYTDTVYKLILPTGAPDTLDKGLLVMRDYADGALLLEEEIERERGVILAEKTARDSAAYRSRLARSAFTMRNTAVPQRQPIGVESVLKQADREGFQAFYTRWYRPDNMVLVMVGDFAVEAAEKLIIKHFASMSAGPRGTCPDYGIVDHDGVETFYHHEPEIGATDVFIETIRNKKPEHDSRDLQIRTIKQHLASAIINHRLTKLSESAETPFSSAGYYDTAMFDLFRITGIRARTTKENWRGSLAAIDGVLEQALRYGFTEPEVERVKKEMLAGMENRLLGAETRNSLHLVNQIIAHLNRNRVMMSPEQEVELFRPVIERITAKDLEESLTSSWLEGERIVQVVGDAELTMNDSHNELKDFYAGLSDRAVEPPEQDSIIAFPYLAFPEHDTAPVRITDYPDIDARRIDFDNGLIVNIKRTSFKKNQIRVALHFGSGRMSMPAKGLDRLAASLVNGSGTATFKKSQINEALSGSSVWYRFRVGGESFVIEGKTISSEAELLLQTVYTLLMDPGFREDEYVVSMKQFDTMYRRLEQDISGAEQLYVDPFFTGDAVASGLPEWYRFSAYERQDVIDWLKPYFTYAPLELSIVGDIDEDELIRLAGRYFGSLPGRNLTGAYAPQAVFPAGREFEAAIDSTIDKAMVKFAWLTDDYRDMNRSRRLHVLAAVFEERLRKKMREELGKTYSPSVWSAASRIYQDYGAVFARVVVDRGSIDIARTVLAAIGDSLTVEPIGEMEVERAREPIVTSIRDTLRTNGYWLNSVLALSSRNQEQLGWPTTVIADLESITSDQINELARTYIRNDRRGIAVIKPKAGNSD